MTHILIAFYEDVPQAAYQLMQINSSLYFPYGGSVAKDRTYSSYLLMWEAIKLGQHLGLKTFDLSDILWPMEKTHPWWGLSKFKLGFGSSQLLAPDFDFILNKNLYSAAAERVKKNSLAVKDILRLKTLTPNQ